MKFIITLAAAFVVIPVVVSQPALAAGHVGSPTCPIGAPSSFGRAICDGYFTGADQWQAGVDVNNVLPNPSGNDALMPVGNVDEFIDAIEAGLYGADATQNTGTAFLIHTMLGAQGADFSSIVNGVTQAKAEFTYWEALIRWYDAKGYVDWNGANDLTTMSNFINSGVSTKSTLDGTFFMDVGPKDRALITFTNPDGSKYVIDKNCANPTGLADPGSPSGWTLTPLAAEVEIGNFVWFDANRDGIVNQDDANYGFNDVTMNLFNQSADTNSDGQLSAAELTAATPMDTTTTANDTRDGSPTLGKAGYYQFTSLPEASYFICVGSNNFDTSGTLHRYTNSPVPPGVADTQNDKNNHGAVPAGGTLQNAGVCSTAIALSTFDEPTTGSPNPDDDTNAASDFTIDFAFWHSYSLGNRVWLDQNNSGDIDAPDGTNPGIANVVVALHDCSGNQLTTTTTDDKGYYRFDDLNSGCYQAEVVKSNFTNNTTLATCSVSSTGPHQSSDPDNNIDSDDNGINPAVVGDAVRTGSIHLGPFNSEPVDEVDVAASGQGTDDDFANMTLDVGFICGLANTGTPTGHVLVSAIAIISAGALLAVRRNHL